MSARDFVAMNRIAINLLAAWLLAVAGCQSPTSVTVPIAYDDVVAAVRGAYIREPATNSFEPNTEAAQDGGVRFHIIQYLGKKITGLAIHTEVTIRPVESSGTRIEMLSHERAYRRARREDVEGLHVANILRLVVPADSLNR